MKKIDANVQASLLNALATMAIRHPVYDEVISAIMAIIVYPDSAQARSITRAKHVLMYQTLMVLAENNPTYASPLQCIRIVLDDHMQRQAKKRSRRRLMTIVASALWACVAITSSYLYVDQLTTSEDMSFWEHGTRILVTLFGLVMCLATAGDPSTDTTGE